MFCDISHKAEENQQQHWTSIGRVILKIPLRVFPLHVLPPPRAILKNLDRIFKAPLNTLISSQLVVVGGGAVYFWLYLHTTGQEQLDIRINKTPDSVKNPAGYWDLFSVFIAWVL